jgi:hypothetical protein
VTGYATYEVETSVTWMQVPTAVRWSYVSGLFKDGASAAAKWAVRARFIDEAPKDALAAGARDRALDMAFPDPELAELVRFLNPWTFWTASGTPLGVRVALLVLGYLNVEIRERVGFAETGRWTDFVVVIRPPFPWNPVPDIVRWGTGWRWGRGVRFAALATERERERVRTAIRAMKPAHAHCVGIEIEVTPKVIAHWST